ncbi:MAG: autotransporter-associated beta strand repeat-containing protein, partial [Verrucomicrobiales bacterium]|nr:autotransporter-associated beta strand repeat-containing protein [Verrucomicrobiales bacterium]
MNPPKSKSPINPKKLLLLCALNVSALNAFAQSTWLTPGSGTWSVPGNWSGGAPNAVGASARFNTDSAGNDKVITLDTPVTLGSVYIFGAPASATALTFGGSALTFQATAGGALLAVQDQHNVIINSAVSLGSDLQVSLPADGAGAPSTLVLNGDLAGNGHAIAVDVGWQISSVTLGGDISGAGTRVSKSDVGILRFTGNNNTFTGGLALTGGRTETTVSAGAGSGITLGSVAANRNNLGAGNVSVSGNNTVLQIQTSAASQTVNLASGTLTVTNNAQVNILKAATSHTGGAFTVSGGVLDGGAGVSGTLRLSGLDFNKTAGSITNAPNLWLDSGTGATAATVQNIGGSGAINGLGDVTKEGLGTLKVADTVTALSAASLSFRSGTLNFGAGANVTLSGGLTLGVTGTGALTQSVLLGKANQYAGDIEVLPGYALIDSYRNIATVSMGGFDQTIGQLTVGNLAALKLDMGPVGTVNTLTLAKGSNSDVNILNWEGNPDGLANGNAARQDVVLRTGSVNVSDVWFYGYEKGAVNLSGTLKPTTFLTGTFLWLNTDYNDYRNWNSGTNATGMEIPNHAGAIVRNNNNTNIYITGTITLGQWLITNSSNRGAPVAAEDDDDATIIWDSGVAGQAALIQNTGAHLDTGGRLNFVLHSDLRWNVGKTDGITRIISDLISGSGALIIEGNGGYLRNGNSYSGGTIIQSGGRLGLTSGTVATDFALGTGTLTINGGEIFGGHDETTRAIYTVSNPLVIGGNFTASYITFAYGGDVVLNGTRVITVSAAANNNQFTQSVTFSATTNLVGTGALTKGGNYQLQLRSPNNTFSGGLTVTGGELRADIGAGGIVIGALAPGQNYLGSGNINITGGTVRVANNYLAEVRGLITVNYSNYINFYGSGTTLLQSTGTFSGGASHGSIMLEGGQTLVNNGIAWVNTPGIIFASGGTLTGAPVTGLYSLTNHVNGGNALVDTVVSGSFLNINNGQLKLNRDGNWFNTVNLNGGVLRTGTATVNSLGALNLAGNAGIFMEEDSVLTFSAFSATSATQWTAATQLNLANEDGVWNRADALGVTSNYIYITDTTNSGQLDRIAFTGYAPGAMLLNNSGTWYLAPDGATVNEWNGNASAGFSGTTWSAAANWFNGAPDAVGAYAAIREADGKLAGKTISVDGNFTVGTLEIANSAAFTLSGGTLTFDNGGNGAALTLLNSTAPLFNTALQLNDQLRFTNNAAVSVTNLTGKISGTGGIVYSRDSNSNNFGHVLVLNSGNDFSGGFQWIGSMATTPNTATSGNAPRIVFTGNGSYFGTGTLTVGDGTAGRWYQLQPNTTSVTRVVDLGGLVIAGNIFFGQSSANTSAALTLGGSGTVLVTDGTWTLSGNGGNSSNFNSSVGSALTFNMPLAGSGQLQIPAYSRVYFTGGDGSFTGRVSVSGDYSEVTIGSDLALGSGTINLGSAGEFRVVRAANGARTLANTFVLGSYVSWVGNFTLTGSSTLASAMTMGIQNAVTFAADNALAGSGGMSLGSSYGVTVTGGTLVLLGSNSYTGYTSVQSVNLAVGNDHALGTGTLHLSYGSAPTSIATLSSVGGPVTLGNAVVFGSYIRLNGAAGLLTLNPTVAQTSTISSANLAVVVSGGTAAFGSNLTLTGPGALTKSGAGTLRLLNADNDFTGGVQVGQGVLSAQAGGGNITLGKAAAGENYFGSGLVSFVSGNYVRTLELVSTGSVTLAGNLNLIGNSVTYTANVNVTEQSGTVSGNSVKTYLNPDSGMVIAGNEHGYLRVAGDLVKTGAGTVNFAAGNLVSGGAFRMESGALDWNGGNIVTSNLSYTGGALTLGSINSPGTQQLTLGTVTLTVQADANAMLTGATLNVTGNAVIDLNSSGVLTLAGATAGWSGSLTVSDWHGELAGGGDSRLQFVNSVPAELLATTVFADADPEVAYLPGARVTRNYLGYYELVPLGAGAEWTGVDGNYEWATINNWDPNTLPNAAGAVAAFRSADAALNGQTVTLGGNVFLGGLVLDSPAASYTIGGPYVLYFQNLPGAAAYVQMSNVNAVLLDTEIVLPGNLEIQHHGSGALVFDRNISGIGGITKDGPGTVLFNAGNTYLGGFTLRDGTVVIGHPDALAGGQLIFAGGTLSTGGAARTLSNNHTLSGTTFFSGTVTLAGNGLVTGSAGVITNDTLTLSGPLSGNGQLTKSGPGTLLLTGSNTSTGGFVLAEGITGINNSAALGTGPLTLGAPASPPATLRLDANALNLANNITASGGTIDTQANNATLSGKIAGSGGLTKAGTGTLTVTQSNTYTGTTNISEGVIVATNADALGQSPVSLTSPASPTSLV